MKPVINRVWAMPNKWTFQIPPIRSLLNKYVGDGKGWIDPFAGFSSPAEITNDLNPLSPAKYHLDALTFVNQLNEGYDGVIFDPPYSIRQLKEVYESIGKDFCYEDTLNGGTFFNVKERVTPKIKAGGLAITCGWNSIGFGKGNGFEIIEILMVCHGGQHNDTIVTVERKVNRILTEV